MKATEEPLEVASSLAAAGALPMYPAREPERSRTHCPKQPAPKEIPEVPAQKHRLALPLVGPPCMQKEEEEERRDSAIPAET